VTSALFALLWLATPVSVGVLRAEFPAGVVAQQRALDGDDAIWGRGHVTLVEGTDAEGITYRLIEHKPRKRLASLKPAQLLRRWQASHACAPLLRHDPPPLRRGRQAPPQITFAGTCEGGDVFVVRLLLVDGVGYEIHADFLVRNGPNPSPQALDRAFARFVASASLR
jgi:hypothetical protein